MSIVINTTILSNCCDELINHAKYYANKKDTFYNNSFGNCLTLNKYLSKIQNIYNDISRNIQNINEHLKDYYEDVEAFERQMSNGYGYIKAENINSLVNRYKGSINVFEIDSNIMFQIDTVSFLSNNVSAEIDGINIEKGMSLADLAVCALSFTEGIINVGEMIGDGVMLAGSGICSLLGFDDTATKIGDVIEKDWSKDLYYWTVDATGLNELADPNSTAANISSIAGNITGMVALSVLTGGAAASAFGTGTTTATTVTTLTSGAIGAATSAGSEAELALQQGASIEQAEVTGGIAAGIGALTSGISGRMDALSRGVGANSGSLGIGNIAKYALASFGIGASEPLLNEMVHTSIYKNDGESGLVNNFINNISNDGILLQMFLAGGTNSLGTVGNAIGGIKNYDYYKQEIGDALKKAEIGVESIIKTDNINDISYQLLNFYDTGLIKFNVNDQIYSLYEFIDLKNLSKLNNIKIGDSLKNIIFDGAARISKIFQNPINLSYAGDIAFEDINNHIDDILKAQTISSIPKILNIPQMFNIELGRLRYADITNNKEFSNKILNEGLYHITSLESAQKIMNSSYLKASGNITSYGYKKSFFFAGTPEFGDVALNMSDFETKRVAIKFDIDESELADFKYRDWDDKAVTYRGDYNFDPKKAKIVYLGLTEENGKLVYKEISEQQYNNYETNLSSNKLSNTIRNLQQMAIGYAKGHEYAIKRLNTLKNNIMSGNNKEISNVDINLKSSELNIKRELTEDELSIKMTEYMNLRNEHPKLKDINFEKNTIFLNDELIEKYNHLKTLALEINSGQGSVKTIEDKFNENITAEIPIIKKLTDNELSLKVNEYNILLENIQELKKYNNLEEVNVLPNNLKEYYERFKILKEEIDSKQGYMSLEENKLLNKMIFSRNANLNLKKEILDKVNTINDPILKARVLYMELNKKVHYSMDYLKGTESQRAEIYNQILSFNNLNDNRTVICKGWSELYKELLIDSGFDVDKVKIVGGTQIGNHKWIEIEMADGIIIADATDAINGSIDLASSKGEFATNGFMYVHPSFSGTSLRIANEKKLIAEDLLTKHNEWLLSIDKTLGYANDNGYLLDQLANAKNLFSNSSLTNKIFRSKKINTLDYIFSMDIPSEMDGYEVYAYYKKIVNNILGPAEKNNISFHTLFNKIDNRIEPMFVMNYNDSRESKYFVYMKDEGKLVINGTEKFKKFKQNFDLIN